MLRLVLMWVLVAAVPLQGFAAVAMRVCGAEQRSQTPMSSEHHHEAMRDAVMAMPTPHRHEAAATSVGVAAPTVSSPDRHGHHNGHAFTKCSACGACCASTAVLGGFRVASLVSGADSFTFHVVRAVHAFLTPGLERPPRSSFA